MDFNRDEYFIKQITTRTGLSPEEVKAGIKEDREYPVSEKFEEGLVVTMRKFVDSARALDSMVEQKGMDISEMMDAAVKTMEDAGVAEEDMKVAEAFYNAAKNLFGNRIDHHHAMPSGVVDIGHSMIIINFADVIGDLEHLKNSPDGKLHDYIENTPSAALFIDTTPGEEGFRAFYFTLY